MEEIFLVYTQTNSPSEIVGGHFLVKANSEEEAKEKMSPSLYNVKWMNSRMIEEVTEIKDISTLNFENDVYQINDFIIE